MPLTATSSLLDAVRSAQLLRPAQLSELELAGADRFPEARSLAQHLMERGWLTPYQVNQVLLGRAAELMLGPYLLIERLGEGFGGTVFKARHTRMNRTVALRSIRKELLADAQAIQQFYKQVEAASRLSHDNLVHAYDAGPVGETHFLAVEYVGGTDLARLVKQGGPLAPPQACDYVAQAALGLQHGCEHGLTHRGLTPSKLLVTQAAGSDARVPLPDGDAAIGSSDRKRDRPGMVKISDLGLSQLRRASRDDTATVSAYMAPEQLAEGAAVDHRADVFALGAILHYLLSGRPPTPGQPIETLCPDLPEPVHAALKRMLAVNPADRFQTAGAAAQALMDYASQHRPAVETHLDFYTPNSTSAPGSTVNILPAVTEPKRRAGSDGLRLVLLVSLGGLLLLGGGLAARLVLPSGAPASRPAVEPPLPTITTAAAGGWLDPRGLTADDLRLGGSFPNLVGVLRPPSGPVRTLAFHPKGTLLATAGDDGQIYLWDWTTGKRSMMPEGHTRPVVALAFSSDGQLLASGGRDKKVKVWDVGSRKEKFVQGTPGEWVTFVFFDGDNRSVGARNNTKEIRLWDLASRASIGNYKFGDKTVVCLACRPDGKALAVGVERSLQLWDAPPRKRLGGADTHGGTVSAVAFSPDSKLLASGSHDKTIKLWDADDGKERGTLSGHTGHVISLTFTPDGQALASAGNNGQLILWNPVGRVSIAEGQLPADVTEIAVSPDGRHLAAASVNGAICIFRIGPK